MMLKAGYQKSKRSSTLAAHITWWWSHSCGSRGHSSCSSSSRSSSHIHSCCSRSSSSSRSSCIWPDDSVYVLRDSCYSQLGLLEKLLAACITSLKPEHLDLPIGLVGRLVLSSPAFIDQFINVINSHNVSASVWIFTVRAVATYSIVSIGVFFLLAR